MSKRHLTLLVAFFFIFWFAVSSQTQVRADKSRQVVTIAEQYGLAYAPIQIMRQLKLLEKNLPGVQVKWRQLGNTAIIREAMLAGEVDMGFMAIPPFLIGYDKGMQWKIACGLSQSPVGLVTNRNWVRSIKDFSSKDRIAVPQPGSVQHILLSMACEQEMGDARKYDKQLVTLAHPDGMTALLAKKDITAHFTAPPYLFMELETKGARQVLDGREVMGGDFTFIVGVVPAKFHDENPRTYKAIVKSIGQAIDYLNADLRRAAQRLAPEYQLPEEELFKYLTWPGMAYTTAIKGIDRFSGFMLSQGYLSRKPRPKEILWDDEP